MKREEIGLIGGGVAFAALLTAVIAAAAGTLHPVSLPQDKPGEGVGRYADAEIYRGGTVSAPAEIEEDWFRPEEAPVVWTAVRDIGSPDYNLEAEIVPEYLLDVPLDRYLQEYIHGLCEEEGIPFTLAVAVIEAESSYIPSTISVSNDWGLMQINAVCHEWLAAELGITDFLDPYQSVRAGLHILGGYLRQYGYSSGALMAYNMGQAAAEWYFGQGIYETDYSRRVLGIEWRLEVCGK